MGFKIELDLDHDLCTVDGVLQIKSNPDSTMSTKSDGIYAAAPQGDDGACFTTGGSDMDHCIRIEDGVVNLTSQVHRIFVASDDDGLQLIGFRPQVDVVMAGDMFRVAKGNMYDYHLITAVTNQPVGNNVTAHIILGRW